MRNFILVGLQLLLVWNEYKMKNTNYKGAHTLATVSVHLLRYFIAHNAIQRANKR